MRSIILALLIMTGFCAAASAQSVGGTYTVKGTNPNGSTYSGTAEITPSGGTCRVVWNVGSTWRGICMVSGDAFAASYRNGETFGLLIYRMHPDGTLQGVWTIADGGSGTETLIPAK
jgi:hypothetical protein